MDKILHAKAIIEKENIIEAEGVIQGIIGSTSVVDRMGDIIEQDGWNLKNFKANPVILWGHNVRDERMPIGQALKVWVEGTGKKAKLMFDIKFDLADSFAAEVFRKIKEGYIRTVSVGFIPSEWEELEPGNWWGGLKYLKQELLELSVVPVPANPQALMPMKSFAETDKRFTPIEEKDLFPQIKDNRYKKLLQESVEVTLAQAEEVKDGEHLAVLRNSAEFEDSGFRAVKMKKDGKEYISVVGLLKGTEAYVEHSRRFNKDVWNEEEIKDVVGEGVTDTVGTDKEHTENEGAEVEKASATMTDDTEMPNVTASQLRGMMNEVWKNGYEAGDEADEKGMGVPDDETKVKNMKVGQCKALMNDCFASMKTDEDKAMEVDDATAITTIKVMSEHVLKAGRVLSSKNENKVRQAVELLGEVLSALDKQADDEEVVEEKSKKAIPFKDLGTLPETENWDGPGEIAKATVEQLKIMAGWFDDEKPEAKASYKLIHHKAEGDNKAVWRGVLSAMASLLGAKGGADIPEEDRKAVYNHLVKHYEQFGKEAPEYKFVEQQVLAHFDEEIHAVTLEREEKHIARLIKKVLDNQKEVKKSAEEQEKEQVVEALKLLNEALDKVVPKK